MGKIEKFEDLIVWQKAHELVVQIYCITKDFPSDERFGLTSQIRRAVVSVTSNIAEGFIRFGVNDKKRFYNMAYSSLIEVKSQLYVARDLFYVNEDIIEELMVLVVYVGKLLVSLSRSLSADKSYFVTR